MQVTGHYKNSRAHALSLVLKIKNENINFFDAQKVEKLLDTNPNFCFLKRIYNEMVFLNSIYLDWFNGERDIVSFGFAFGFSSSTVEETQSFLNTCKEVHKLIHSNNQ